MSINLRNRYLIRGETTILFDRKDNKIIVDTEDLEKLSKYKWYVDKSKGYVFATVDRKIRMHKYILDEKGFVDHINRNRSDNRKSNLRRCSITENNRNKGLSRNNKLKAKGVIETKDHNRTKKYRARIEVNGKKKHLGYFKTKEEAQDAYNKAAAEYFGEYAAPILP